MWGFFSLKFQDFEGFSLSFSGVAMFFLYTFVVGETKNGIHGTYLDRRYDFSASKQMTLATEDWVVNGW